MAENKSTRTNGEVIMLLANEYYLETNNCGETVKIQIGDKVTEIDGKWFNQPCDVSSIVKPYLMKLKAKMEERDNDKSGIAGNSIDAGYHLAVEHLVEEINAMRSEIKGKKYV